MAAETIGEAVQALYFWQCGTASGFETRLFEIIGASDEHNRARLRLAFQAEVDAWQQWHDAPSPSGFFAGFGLGAGAIKGAP